MTRGTFAGIKPVRHPRGSGWGSRNECASFGVRSNATEGSCTEHKLTNSNIPDKSQFKQKKSTAWYSFFIYFASNLSPSLVGALLPALISEILREISSANLSFTAKVTATLSE